MANYDWDDEAILKLRTLWDEGISTSEIGRRFGGLSKNQIVGKAHRLDLPARPSPIRGVVDPEERQKRLDAAAALKAPKSTLPILPSVVTEIVRSIVDEPPADPPAVAVSAPSKFAMSLPAAIIAPVAPPAAALPPSPVEKAERIAPPAIIRRAAPSCCWPIGEPGKRDFRYCDDASVPGKPYCDEHAKLAYVRIRPRSADAEIIAARLAG